MKPKSDGSRIAVAKADRNLELGKCRGAAHQQALGRARTYTQIDPNYPVLDTFNFVDVFRHVLICYFVNQRSGFHPHTHRPYCAI